MELKIDLQEYVELGNLKVGDCFMASNLPKTIAYMIINTEGTEVKNNSSTVAVVSLPGAKLMKFNKNTLVKKVEATVFVR